MSDVQRKPDGTIDLPRTAAHVSLELHQVYDALSTSAALCRDIRDLMPKRGELVDMFVQLVSELASIEERFRNADDTLMTIAQQVDWEALGIDPLPLTGPDECVA